MKKKKKRKPHRHKKPFQLQTTHPAVNPIQQSIEVLNRLKPVMAAVQRTAARQRERQQQAGRELSE